MVDVSFVFDCFLVLFLFLRFIPLFFFPETSEGQCPLAGLAVERKDEGCVQSDEGWD